MIYYDLEMILVIVHTYLHIMELYNSSRIDNITVFIEPSCEDGMIRLSPDGPNPNEGRVEMCYQNIWGAVYDQSWSQFDATVVCAQLNFSRGGQKNHSVLNGV